MTGRVPTGVRHLVLGRAEKLPVWHGAVQLRLQQRQAGGQISHANSSTKHVAKASRRASSMSQAATAAVFSSYGRSAGGDSASSDRIGFAYPRGAATTTGCPCAGSRCECAAFAGRGHNTRWSSLAIERTERHRTSPNGNRDWPHGPNWQIAHRLLSIRTRQQDIRVRSAARPGPPTPEERNPSRRPRLGWPRR